MLGFLFRRKEKAVVEDYNGIELFLQGISRKLSVQFSEDVAFYQYKKGYLSKEPNGRVLYFEDPKRTGYYGHGYKVDNVRNIHGSDFLYIVLENGNHITLEIQ